MSDGSTLVQQLADMAAGASPSTLPAEVRASVVQRVIDIVGLSAAAFPLDTSQAVLDHVAEQGGAQQATVTGLDRRAPAAQAAFVHGVLAHSLDFDDTHLPSILHPSATVVPAALAVGEAVGATGADVVDAVAVGLEVCVRLGMAGFDSTTRNSAYFDRGQHATSICGAIAAAASAGKLAGLGADGIAHAMGLAVSMTGGVIEANRTGGTVKRVHCGWAAHAGVVAADLARRGFTAPPTVLEGRFGFFQAFLGGIFDEEAIVEGLGERWAAPEIFFKPYPANHFTHTAIDAAIELRTTGLDLASIESIHLGVASPTVRTIGEPIEQKRRPDTGYQAQFSGPYTVAAALLADPTKPGLGLDDFTDDLAREPRRRALMSKVSVGPDERCDAIYPYQFPAVLRVRTVDGSEVRIERLVNRGGADDPLTSAELVAKFRDNARRSLPVDAVDSLASAMDQLETATDMGAVLAPITQARS